MSPTENKDTNNHIPTPSTLRALAEEVARIGGAILIEGFAKTKTLTYKPGVHNIVTEYDVASEKAIIAHISALYPQHSFLAEESGASHPSDSIRWIIDPLDGTVNYAHGIPIFSVSVAAEYQGTILAGAIFQPITNEMFSAAKGEGATLNGTALQVSHCGELKSCFAVTGFPYNVSSHAEHNLGHVYELINMGVPVRRLGSAAVDMAYVAAGRFDVFWEVGLSPWDVAAGIVLVQEAGGIVSNYAGEEYGLESNTIVAANPSIHGNFINFLARV